MRLFVIGPNGHTGTQIVDLALARGHDVTAFLRSPEKIGRRHERLRVVRGDPHDPRQLAEALQGHDAVLSALGVRPPGAFRPHTVVRDGAASTVAAMARSGVTRLLVVSTAVLFPVRGPLFALFRWILTYVRRDQAAAEEIVRGAPVDWTILRPPRLVNGPAESYRVFRDGPPSATASMTFRAVAAFMLDAAERGAHVRETVGLAG